MQAAATCAIHDALLHVAWHPEGQVVGTINLVRQALGILYERDAQSLVPDHIYDLLGRICGDAAATAMDWATYPQLAFILADACLEESKRRLVVGNSDCPGCGGETWGLECRACQPAGRPL